MVHPEHQSCKAGTGTAGDGLACLGLVDSFARVTGAVVAASDQGCGWLVQYSRCHGSDGQWRCRHSGCACGTGVLGAGNLCGSGSSGAGCAAMWHSLR